MDAPYQWTKQVASHFGGTRTGTIVHWPARIEAKGEPREPVPPGRDRRGADHQLEAAGLPQPTFESTA